jgi:hypothetical protein
MVWAGRSDAAPSIRPQRISRLAAHDVRKARDEPQIGRETGIRAPGRPQRSEGPQGINALGYSPQLLAQLLNREPRLLLLLQGGIDRIDPLQALLDRGEYLLFQQGDLLFPIGELNAGAALRPAGGALQDSLHAAERGQQQQ